MLAELCVEEACIEYRAVGERERAFLGALEKLGIGLAAGLALRELEYAEERADLGAFENECVAVDRKVCFRLDGLRRV